MSNQPVATAAAELVGGHEYLLKDILLSLPVKSVTRFKLVSKQWLSLISDPPFVHDNFRCRRSSYNSPTGMILCPSKVSSNNIDFIPFNDLNPTHQTIPSLEFLKKGSININNLHYDIEVRQSCNGLLLCFVITDHIPHLKLKNYDYVVCNPTTKKFRLLPRGPNPRATSQGVLAFDPSISIHYKLVCVRNQLIGRDGYAILLSDDYVLDIYSSEDNLWRSFTSPFRLPWYQVGSYLNGSIYWDLYHNEGCWNPYVNDEEVFHLCFDVNAEKMTRPRAYPPPIPPKHFCCHFNESGGRLHCYIMHKDSSKDLRIFELSIDSLGTSNWIAKSQVCVSTLLRISEPAKSFMDLPIPEPASSVPIKMGLLESLRSYFRCFVATTNNVVGATNNNDVGIQHQVLYVVEGLREEDFTLVFAAHGKVYSYNFIDKTVEELIDFQGDSDKYPDLRAFPFVESLFAV